MRIFGRRWPIRSNMTTLPLTHHYSESKWSLGKIYLVTQLLFFVVFFFFCSCISSWLTYLAYCTNSQRSHILTTATGVYQTDGCALFCLTGYDWPNKANCFVSRLKTQIVGLVCCYSTQLLIMGNRQFHLNLTLLLFTFGSETPFLLAII